MSFRIQQAGFWLMLAIFLAVLLYVLGDVLSPFLAGLALAYLLAPLVDKMEGWHVPRTFGAVLALLLALSMVIGLFLLLLPTLFSQFATAVEKIPAYIDQLRLWMTEYLPKVEQIIIQTPEFLNKGEALVSKEFLAELFISLRSGGQAVLSLLAFLVIMPVVTIYILRDWSKIITFIDNLLPKKHAVSLRKIILEIDQVLSASLRGQGSVCLTLALFYGIALQLLGLDFGLLIGIFSGLISFIPYAGAIFGFIVALQSGLFQFWPDWSWALMICGGVFIVGQVLEGYVLTPKLVGEKVGLHALWIIFALVAFGALWGTAGLLVALPLSATIGVLLRYGIRSYQKSNFYKRK